MKELEIKFRDLEGKELEVKELNPNHFGGMCSREIALPSSEKRKEFDFEKGFDVVATTEAPAIIADWDRMQYVREVLPMKYVDKSGPNKVPFLDTHSRSSVHKILGSAFDFKEEGADLIAKVTISSVETAVRTKISEGHIDSVSLGYMTDADKTVEVPKGKEVIVDGVSYRNDYGDNLPMVVRLWWKKKELSAVPIGADEMAKFRAELQGKITSEDPELQKKLDELHSEIKNLKNDNQELNIKLKERGNTMEEPKVPTPDDFRKAERERIAGIEAIGAKFAQSYKGGKEALDAKIKEAINGNQSVDAFRAHVFDNYDESKPVERPANEIGMTDKEVGKFSISKAIAAEALLRGGDSRAYDKLGAGFEREVLTETLTKVQKENSELKPRGLVLPFELIAQKMIKPDLQKRTLTVGSNSAGGYLVGTDHLADMFIPMLRNTTIAGQAGVKILSGLKGNIEVPKQLTAGTFAWGSENWAVTDTDLTLGQVTASPKEGKSSTTYGRKLLLQSSPAIDQIVADDLLSIARIGLDYAVFHGAGTNEPTGIMNTSGIGDVVGASVDWDAILEFESDIATANADGGSLKFATNPAVRAILKGRLKSSGVDGYLMSPDGKINGYDALISNQIGANTMIFGDYSKVWLCDWSMFDLLVNPYKDNTGNVTVVVFVYADVVVSQASAFTAADDVN